MTSSITYGNVTLTIEGVTSFLQLLDVQNVRRNKCFSLNKSCEKFWQSVQMVESLYTKEDLFIFLIFLCVRIEINSPW